MGEYQASSSLPYPTLSMGADSGYNGLLSPYTYQQNQPPNLPLYAHQQFAAVGLDPTSSSPMQESTTSAEFISQTNVDGEDSPTLRLLNQVEFYFSHRNLQGDFFLRQCMDREGWVPISTVASFNRVRKLTTDLSLVLNTLLYSTVLAVDPEYRRVRKAVGWEPYILAGAAEPMCSPTSHSHHPHSHSQYASPTQSTVQTPNLYPSEILVEDVSRPVDHANSSAPSDAHHNLHLPQRSSSDDDAIAPSSSTTTPATDRSKIGDSLGTDYPSPPTTISRRTSQMDDEIADGAPYAASANLSGYLTTSSTDDDGEVVLGVVAAEGLGGTLNSKAS